MSYCYCSLLLSGLKTGVLIRVPGYGDVEGVDYLDTDKQMGVWNSTIAVLKALGYQVGEAYKTFHLLFLFLQQF